MDLRLRLVCSAAAAAVSIPFFYSAYVQWNTELVHAQVIAAFEQNRPVASPKLHETKQLMNNLRTSLRSLDATSANSRYRRNFIQLQTKLDAVIWEIDKYPDEKSSTFELLSFGVKQVLEGQRSVITPELSRALSELNTAMLELKDSKVQYW